MYTDLNKIAITGFSGAIGKEFPTQCIKLKTRLEENYLKMLMELNKKYSKIDTLIHLAGMTSINDCENNPELAYQSNVTGSLKWYLAAEKANIKKFIFVSSSHVYETHSKNEINVNINYNLSPNNVYGRTKLLAEKILTKISKKQKKTKLLIARVFSIITKYGRKHTLVEGLKRRAQNLDFSKIEGFHDKKDFLTSKVVAERLIRLAFSTSNFLIVNICSGKAKSIGDIACKIFEEAKLDKQKLIYNNSDQLKLSHKRLVGKPTLF